MRIEACTDSHVHWAATGDFADRLTLSPLKSARDILTLKIPAARGGWVLGFGWDETPWTDEPTREILDRWCPDIPVALSRVDGHALWVNSLAARAAKIEPSNGDILRDRAADPVHAAIAAPTGMELRRQLLRGAKIFNEAGYTHIRDMAADPEHFHEAVRLDEVGLLTLAVEQYFQIKNADDLVSIRDFAVRARAECTPNLRVGGLKIFLDGTLGSKTAALSQAYPGQVDLSALFWSPEQLRTVVREAFANNLGLAAHAIGDLAADQIADVALEMQAGGHSGRLHIEHGQVMRAETIAKLAELKATVHFQPAHFLTDSAWLKERLGDLQPHAFPWRKLQEADVDFDFGSDSPIDPPSIARVFRGVEAAAASGLPRLLGSPARYLENHDRAWAPNSFTQLDEELRPIGVTFRGESLR